MLMAFISTFKDYSSTTGNNIPTFLWQDEEKLSKLINLYSNTKVINNFLLRELEKYNINDDENFISRRNLIKVIGKLNEKWLLVTDIREKIIQKLKLKIKEIQLWKVTYNQWVLEINLFFQLSPSFEDVESIFSESLSIDWYDYFLTFSIKINNRKFFQYLLIQYNQHYESEVDKNDFKFYLLQSEEFLDYILSDKKTNVCFIKSLVNKPKTIYSFLKWYYIPKQKIISVFSNWKNDDIQLCIWTILKEYCENRNYSFDRILKEDLLWCIIQLENEALDFVNNIFSYMEEHQYVSFWTIILKSLLTINTFDLFMKYNRWRRTVLSLYYSLEDDTGKWEIKSIFYNSFSKIIDENESKNEELRKESLEKLTENEEKIRNDVRELVDNNIDIQNKTKLRYFAWNVLYLYKEHKELFEETQVEFVKDQIQLYFTSKSTNPWDKKCKVTYPKENSFSWPRFISDLQLCLEIAFEGDVVDLLKYKERIIYLIPYLFNSSLSPIIKLFKENKEIINEKKMLNWLLDVYLHKQNDGLWYLHPSRLIYLINNWLIKISDLDASHRKKLSKICENMIISNNLNISNWDKIDFVHFILNNFLFIDASWLLEFYRNLKVKVWTINYFEDYLNGKLEYNVWEQFLLFVEVNEALIRIIKNDDAIQWRLSQLMWLKTEIVEDKETWIHSISKLESELIRWWRDDTFFYSVLIDKLKYWEYEIEIKNILKHIKSLKLKHSATKNYLYNFVASYYKLVPNNKKIQVYSKISDKDFVLLYLWANYWSDADKLKFRIRKEQDSREKQYLSRIKKLWDLNEEKDRRIKNLEETLSNLEYQYKDFKNNVLIFTEWKSDWKHLVGVAKELKKKNPKSCQVYDFFLDHVCCYDKTMWDTLIYEFSSNMASLFPSCNIILILDTDGNINKYSETENFRVVTLPRPWKYEVKKYKKYYDENKWCIELLYGENILKDKFIVPRDLGYKIVSKYWIEFLEFEFCWENYLIKKNKNSNVHDLSSTFYDDKWNQRNTHEKWFQENCKIISKSNFADMVYSWQIKFKKSDIILFDPLFQEIYKIWSSFSNN